MVMIKGKPFLEHQLALLKNQGIEHALILTGHLSEKIVAHFGDGKRLGMKLTYHHDGGRPLGTGGALAAAAALLHERFFVQYGDSYLPYAYASIWRLFEEIRATALMVVYKNENRHYASNIAVKDGLVIDYDNDPDKRQHFAYVDAGLSLLSKTLLTLLPKDRPSATGEMFKALCTQRRLHAYSVSERPYEIGSPQGLQEIASVL